MKNMNQPNNYNSDSNQEKSDVKDRVKGSLSTKAIDSMIAGAEENIANQKSDLKSTGKATFEKDSSITMWEENERLKAERAAEKKQTTIDREKSPTKHEKGLAHRLGKKIQEFFHKSSKPQVETRTIISADKTDEELPPSFAPGYHHKGETGGDVPPQPVKPELPPRNVDDKHEHADSDKVPSSGDKPDVLRTEPSVPQPEKTAEKAKANSSEKEQDYNLEKEAQILMRRKESILSNVDLEGDPDRALDQYSDDLFNYYKAAKGLPNANVMPFNRKEIDLLRQRFATNNDAKVGKSESDATKIDQIDNKSSREAKLSPTSEALNQYADKVIEGRTYNRNAAKSFERKFEIGTRNDAIHLGQIVDNVEKSVNDWRFSEGSKLGRAVSSDELDRYLGPANKLFNKPDNAAIDLNQSGEEAMYDLMLSKGHVELDAKTDSIMSCYRNNNQNLSDTREELVNDNIIDKSVSMDDLRGVIDQTKQKIEDSRPHLDDLIASYSKYDEFLNKRDADYKSEVEKLQAEAAAKATDDQLNSLKDDLSVLSDWRSENLSSDDLKAYRDLAKEEVIDKRKQSAETAKVNLPPLPPVSFTDWVQRQA